MGVQAGWRALASAVFAPSGRFPAWAEDAACVGEDPRLFDGGNTRAREICGQCPVASECLADQMAWERQQPTRTGTPTGVFGGTNDARSAGSA